MVEVTSTQKLIVVVEDDVQLAELFHDMLGNFGNWRLHVFADGQSAREQLPAMQADLILLDIGLPDLDGVSLYKILRGHSDTRHIPIIIISGSHDWELHRMGLQTGFLLRKPFSIHELISIIKALLPEEREG